MTSTLKKSNGSTVVSSTLNPITARAFLKAGLAVPDTGASDKNLTSVVLKDSATDTKINNATAQAPVSLGLDDIRAVPCFYPEQF